MNDFSIGFSVPLWLAIPIVLAGFAFAVWTYQRTVPPVSSLRRWTLISLRTIGITLLLLVLLEPIFSRTAVDVEEPEVLAALDFSESMTLSGTRDRERITEEISTLDELLSTDLGDVTTPLLFSDSARVHRGDLSDGTQTPSGPETNLSLPFAFAADSLRRRNVQAIVLLTDGRYNVGANPMYDAERLGIPVFAVGLGDSTEPKDLSVQEVFTNEVAWVGTQVPVQIRSKSAGYPSGQITVTLSDDNGVVGRQSYTLLPGANEYVSNFVWTPKREGVARLTATVSGQSEEYTTKNNAKSVLVNVRSNRRRYVLISGSPNPDVAFLRRLLEDQPEIEVKTFIQGEGSRFLEGSIDASTFNETEAVILVDYPTTGSSDATLDAVRNAVANRNLPLLVVLGAQVDYEKLRRLEGLLPVRVGTGRGNETQVFADLTPQGTQSPIMRTTDSAAWRGLPPIFRSETGFEPRPESRTLATARLGSVALGEPLIVARDVGRSRSLIVLGYGLWRWQLIGAGEQEARGVEASNVLRDFVENSLRWLAIRDDNKRVRIRSSKEIYNLGESVRIIGEVYDESYQPEESAEVTVRVEGAGRTHNMTLAPSGNGRYEGVLSRLPAGDYRFNGSAKVGGQTIGSDAGRFVIDEVGLEFAQPSMNAPLLRALAERTGGRFYTIDQVGSLADDIRALETFAPRSVERRDDFTLLDSIIPLLLAIAAFAFEWFLRKRSGMV